MAATIRDIAKEAGVSVATVSRLINRSGYVGARTAARVQDAIERLGFRSNAIGRSLSTAKTRTFGVIVPALSNPVFAEAVSGVTACARAEKFRLNLSGSGRALPPIQCCNRIRMLISFSYAGRQSEPLRVYRRIFCLSHAATAGSSGMA